MLRRALVGSLVFLGLVMGCGGDDAKKVRTSCADDSVCGGGVCFEQYCYDACSATTPCAADDEVCVRKDRDGAEVQVCVVAADFFAGLPACTNAQPDCEAIVRGVCQVVGCHAGECVVEPMNDGIQCQRRDGQMDVCQAGVCGSSTAEPCDDPSGVWSATVSHPENESTASCVVDGMVAQQITMAITKGTDGSYQMVIDTTNNIDPETDECFTHTEEWPGGIFEDGVVTLTKTTTEPRDCNGVPTDVPVTYGFEGTLGADCTTIEGTSWKEPADPCDPDSGRYDIPGVVFTKSTGAPTYAFH